MGFFIVWGQYGDNQCSLFGAGIRVGLHSMR